MLADGFWGVVTETMDTLLANLTDDLLLVETGVACEIALIRISTGQRVTVREKEIELLAKALAAAGYV